MASEGLLARTMPCLLKSTVVEVPMGCDIWVDIKDALKSERAVATQLDEMQVDCTIKASKEAREQKGQSIIDLMIAKHCFRWGRLHVVIGR